MPWKCMRVCLSVLYVWCIEEQPSLSWSPTVGIFQKECFWRSEVVRNPFQILLQTCYYVNITWLTCSHLYSLIYLSPSSIQSTYISNCFKGITFQMPHRLSFYVFKLQLFFTLRIHISWNRANNPKHRHLLSSAA